MKKFFLFVALAAILGLLAVSTDACSQLQDMLPRQDFDFDVPGVDEF